MGVVQAILQEVDDEIVREVQEIMGDINPRLAFVRNKITGEHFVAKIVGDLITRCSVPIDVDDYTGDPTKHLMVDLDEPYQFSDCVEVDHRRVRAEEIVSGWPRQRRSHDDSEIVEALLAGVEVWALNTVGAGEDDVLIGPRAAVIEGIQWHHGHTPWAECPELPEGWTLEEVGPIEKQK